MSEAIDPALTYRIRSRGVEKPAVEGHRLPQLVRDFVLARHDELSPDGKRWFAAGEVESLFPSAANARIIRDRLGQTPRQEQEEVESSLVDVDADERVFPREPWYIARGSNVAGPYDQVTITEWYETGRLYDEDQLRPGMKAKWRSLRKAKASGLLQPPPANTCSASPVRLVADPPIWMGPASRSAPSEDGRAEATPRERKKSRQATNNHRRLLIASAVVVIIVTSSLLAWLVYSSGFVRL